MPKRAVRTRIVAAVSCFCLAGLAAWILGCWRTERDGDAGRSDRNGISFADPTYRVGDVPQGVPLTVTFAFKNNSRRKAAIVRVRTGCSCTRIITPIGQVTPPLQNGNVQVEYSPPAGPAETPVFVEFSTGELHDLRITSYGYADAFLSKADVNFGLLAEGHNATDSLTVLVDSRLASGSNVSLVSRTPPWMTISIVPNHEYVTEGEIGGRVFVKAADVSVNVSANAPKGRFRVQAYLAITAKEHTERPLTFACRGVVQSEVEASPNEIVLLLTPDTSTRSQRASFIIRSVKDTFRVLSVKSDGVECHLDGEATPTRRATFIVVPTTRENVSGFVRILLEHPEIDEILVPVKLFWLDTGSTS